MDNKLINNSLSIPEIGFGTWQIGDGEKAVNAVRSAIETGYRHIDTASFYGNEKSVGEAIRTSGVARTDIFVTSKVWNDERGYDNTLKACERSLKRLGLEYIDLYLIHWPASKLTYPDYREINTQTWKALIKLYKDKVVRSIGVSNFNNNYLKLIMDMEYAPMVDQIEFHPGFTQNETVSFCKANNIILEGWSPLAEGKVFRNEILLQMSKKYNKSVAQICIRWILQNGVIPLPKASSIEKMKNNLDVYDFCIEEKDMNIINSINNKELEGCDLETAVFEDDEKWHIK